MHISERPRPDLMPSSADSKLTGALNLPPLRQSRRAVWIVAAAVVLVVAAVVVPKLFATPAVPVATVTATAAERVLAVTGRIRPRESVQVVPRIAGQVKELTRREGEAVNAGDILGRIDDARGRTAVAQALAAADAQRRILDQAERDLTRAQSLRERGNGTQTTVETAMLAVTRGREDLRRLIAAADEAKLRLEEYLIVAPLTGRLLTRPVDRGQVVDGKTTLFEIAPTGDRERNSSRG